MIRISYFCEKGAHSNCPIQQPQNREYPKCQCECHPGTMSGTWTAKKGDDRYILI